MKRQSCSYLVDNGLVQYMYVHCTSQEEGREGREGMEEEGKKGEGEGGHVIGMKWLTNYFLHENERKVHM